MDGRVRKAELTISRLLDRLENFYGSQQRHWPVDPYEFLGWGQCGYPASDAACAKGWKKLQSDVGIAPEHLLSATPGILASALKPGGMGAGVTRPPAQRDCHVGQERVRRRSAFRVDWPAPQGAKDVEKTPWNRQPGGGSHSAFCRDRARGCGSFQRAASPGPHS